MYHRKSYSDSETSAWIFGVFVKFLHLLSLYNLVTLVQLLKSKQRRTFSNFWRKISWLKTSSILFLWSKWNLPDFLEFEEEQTELNFVEIRYKVCRRLHHSKEKSSYLHRRLCKKFRVTRLGFWELALLLTFWLKTNDNSTYNTAHNTQISDLNHAIFQGG